MQEDESVAKGRKRKVGPDFERIKRQVQKFLSQNPFGEFRPSELAGQLGLSRSSKRLLREVLVELEDEGHCARRKGGWYHWTGGRPQDGAEGDRQGVFRRTRAGYGFVETGSGSKPVFVRASLTGGAMDGDVVTVHTWSKGDRLSGSVTKVVERKRDRFVATVRSDESGRYLEPDDPKLGDWVDLKHFETSWTDMAVVARFVVYPSSARERPVAEVVEVLGRPGDVDTEVAKIIVLAGLSAEFPSDVVEEAQKAADKPIEPTGGRKDLRDLFFMTIDPTDAKDFDDALCVEDNPDGTRALWVAIADVSHYVSPQSALDAEARRRAFSLYLPDRAVPMLPESLSSGACSLNPDEDRNAMVVRMDLDSRGMVRKAWFGRAVIRSKARLDYAKVAKVLSGDTAIRKDLGENITARVLRLDETARLLLRRRRARGLLEIETAEPKVLFGPDGVVSDVTFSKPNRFIKRAYSLVEQCMLEANESVGRLMGALGQTVPWRIHPEPKAKRLEALARVLERIGIDVPEELLNSGGLVPTKVLGRVARALSAHPDGDILSIYLLSSLAQASYSAVNRGHYALGCGTYLHFTSPIRRYADLLVHRALGRLVAQGPLERKCAGGLDAFDFEAAKEGQGAADRGRASSKAAQERKGRRGAGAAVGGGQEEGDEFSLLCADISEIERRYMDAEREGVNLFRALLMRDRIGEVFDGRVTGVAPFGVFVATRNPFIEGLVRATDLGGQRWEMDETGMYLVQAGSGRRIGVADSMVIKVVDVSVVRRQVLFVPAGDREDEGDEGRGSRKPKRRRRHR